VTSNFFAILQSPLGFSAHSHAAFTEGKVPLDIRNINRQKLENHDLQLVQCETVPVIFNCLIAFACLPANAAATAASRWVKTSTSLLHFTIS
jgi:hypothetical protein